MLISVIVAIIQFLGFLPSWKYLFTFIGMMLILGIAYRMAPKVKVVDAGSLPYVEHKRDDKVTITDQDVEKTQ